MGRIPRDSGQTMESRGRATDMGNEPAIADICMIGADPPGLVARFGTRS